MKKGFTLVEVIGVLVLLAALSLIIIPVVDKQVKQGKQELYEKQLNSIKLSMELWVSEHQKPNVGETITLTLSQLKQANLVDFDLKNPLDKELFPNDMLLTISNLDGLLEFNVLTDTGSNKEEFVNMPTIVINGKTLDYVEVDSTSSTTYQELGSVSKSSDGSILTATVTTTPELNIAKIGTYLRTYIVTDNSKSNSVIKTIIVRDTTAPVITFENQNLTIGLDEVATYDFKTDVISTDNSGDSVVIEVEHNIGLIAGTYTVTYTATDNSGNVATKLRRVIVKAD